jgi:hypothetical protein
MRLSEWADAAPRQNAMTPKVTAVISSALELLGAEADPECWVAWGDDPTVRYLIFVVTTAGIVQLNVRVNVPGEGPRASGKLVRWNRLQIGELVVEIQGGHRLLNFQLEGVLLRGQDDSADDVAEFAQAVFLAIDKPGRAADDAEEAPTRRGPPPIPQLPAPKPT